ncbi:FAD binding domain-containing protein [Rhizoctonia solani]|nr:FAD binding domain-containing protein [Rhizoctonia solani]
MASTKVDVLIAGAGPAGLMCAYNLSQAGFQVRVVDKKTERLQKGQGDVLQTRGLEILESLGITPQILEEAQRCVHTTTYATSPTSNGEISLTSRKSVVHGIESTLPFMGLYAQSSLEGIIRQALRSGTKHIPSATFAPQSHSLSPSQKVEVEQGVFPVEMKVSDSFKEDHPVTVRLMRPDGQTETVQAKYMLGCDGAHSWTRAQMGIDMVGETSDQVWGIVDAYIETDFPDVRALTVVDNNGRHAVLIPRENDMVRFTVQITDSDVSVDPTTGRIDRTKIGVEKTLELVKEVFKPYRIDFNKGVEWSGVYVIGQRLASSYQGQSGRVFILGDACHTHSPHAGQGMNAAISDAHNLSWKLVHVLKCWATPDILHTYESERRDFAVQLMDLHARIAEVMSGKVKGTSADLMLKSLGFVSGVGTHYPPSAVVDPSNQLRAPGIIIGQASRLAHQVILRTADFRPYSTLDLLKSDNMYKIVILTGDVNDTAQRQKLEQLGDSLHGWLLRRPKMFQLYTIMLAKKENATYTDIPSSLRPYWDTVFIDDIAFADKDGGGRAYQSFGVGPEGCLVLVRPDGHVAALAPLEAVEALQVLSFVKVPLAN